MTRTVFLDDEIELIGGGTPKTNIPEYWDGDIPWLSVVDFNADQRWVENSEKSITEKGLNNSSAKVLNPGDIVISARGTVGELAQLKMPMAFNQSCYGIRSKGNVDQNYLYYLLKFNITDLQRQAHGGVFNTITRNTFKQIKITLPSKVIQEKIANILGGLDQKIELNRRMNETLEEMGQALFKHYFIDNPEAENWEFGNLEDLFEVTMGQSPPGSSYNESEEGVVFYQGKAEFGQRFPSQRLFTTEPKRMAKRGNVLLSVRAPVGDINQAINDCCIGRGLAAISSKEGLTSFSYYFMKHIQKQLQEYDAGGTVFASISGKQIKSLSIRVPPNNLTQEFNQTVFSIDKCIWNNYSQCKALTELRDSLLPRLMSGKIEI
jgi:type I restriction enzyme S subunit